jgi:adenylosuccinate lyase
VAGLVVRPERMAENIERGLGLHASSRLLTALLDEGGLSREAAYAIVQEHALRAADERRSFRDLVAADPVVTAALPAERIAACFDDRHHLRHAPAILARLDVLDPGVAR